MKKDTVEYCHNTQVRYPEDKLLVKGFAKWGGAQKF